jgi:hypothetical protein
MRAGLLLQPWSAIESATDAQLFRMASDLVGKDPNVINDRPQILRQPVDVACRLGQIVVDLGVTNQLAECALRLVEGLGESGCLGKDGIKPADRSVDSLHHRFTPLTQGL